jgi:hypothetical protein
LIGQERVVENSSSDNEYIEDELSRMNPVDDIINRNKK